MEILVGLDASLASTSVCALGANGKTVNEAKAPSDPGSLMERLRELPGSVTAVGLEAGPLSQWLHKGLGEAGFKTVLMETRRVKSSLKAAPVETSRRDAEGIAQLLRTGWFQPVHCKSVASPEKRALLTTCSVLTEGLTRLELSVLGIPRNFGLKLGRISRGRWEERVREPAADDAMLSDAVTPILRLRREMRDELAMMTKKVRSLALPDATCRQLVTMPGVGPVTALAFVAAVDDPARFRRARDIGAWAGLTPKRSQSGERDGYYAKADPGHRKASRWHGQGAAALGLGRNVAPSRFEAVLAGSVPGTDTVLGRIRDGKRALDEEAGVRQSYAVGQAGDHFPLAVGDHDAALPGPPSGRSDRCRHSWFVRWGGRHDHTRAERRFKAAPAPYISHLLHMPVTCCKAANPACPGHMLRAHHCY